MKKITAIVRAEKLEVLKDVLLRHLGNPVPCEGQFISFFEERNSL